MGTAQVYGKAATGAWWHRDRGRRERWFSGRPVLARPQATLNSTGTTSDDVNASFPSNSPAAAAFFAPAGGNRLSTNYTYVLDTGSYKTTKFIVGAGGSAHCDGSAELYVTSDFVMSAPATCGSLPERASRFMSMASLR